MNINQMADDLKDIPQQKLIQYVQDPNSVVPQFLALAEIQRRKTLERNTGAGMPQSTVAQDIMQQASQQGIQGQPGVMGQPGVQQQQGLPAMQRPQGVAALPSGMGEMSYAGGGIIAFAGDKKSDVEDPYADNEYMQRVMRNQERVSNTADDLGLSELTKLKNWDPVQSSYRAVKQGIIDPWNRFRTEGTREQAAGFNVGTEARTGERPTFVNRPEDTARDLATMSASKAEDKKANGTFSINDLTPEQRKALPKDATVMPDGTIAVPIPKAPVPPEIKKIIEDSRKDKAPKKDATYASPDIAPTKEIPKEDMYSKYEQMLKDQAAETKAGREQDKYMRIIEAGLGMMGGTSPYALTNIGQGAMGAIKGYGQDLAAARKEDAGTVKELMGLGMKRQEAEVEAKKLAMQEKLYASHGRYYDAAAAAAGQKAAGAGTAANTRMTIAQEKNAVALYNKWVTANPMATAEEQHAAWLRSQQMAGVEGGGGPAVQPPISWDSLGTPKK